MKLDYLAEGPILRLFDFTIDEVASLRMAIDNLATGRIERIAIHEMSKVVAVGGCKLVLRVQDRDHGISQVGPLSFECRLTADSWDNVSSWIEPFEAGGNGYQWLIEDNEEASLLLSVDGLW